MPVNLAPALEILRREMPDLVAVYAFGSVANGGERPDSDVDLAILTRRPIARLRVLEVQEMLAKALSRDVDLVDLANAPTSLQMQAIGEGRALETPDPDAAGLFEVRVMRDYQDLKARRAEIEADIVRRGRVYAG
ncbi:MAG: nucleotidyltransferase domain-containing protein [Hyphomonadaceae bacterium]